MQFLFKKIYVNKKKSKNYEIKYLVFQKISNGNIFSNIYYHHYRKYYYKCSFGVDQLRGFLQKKLNFINLFLQFAIFSIEKSQPRGSHYIIVLSCCVVLYILLTINMADYKHLIVMVHGFFGLPRCWNYSSKLLQEKLGDSALVYISRINNSFLNGTEV